MRESEYQRGPTRPDGNHALWSDPSVFAELDTPERRYEALANILQNGAQSLTVLTMPSDPHTFSSWAAINAHLNTTVGFTVVAKASTLEHLASCIAPVGAAAKSTIDDQEWALTAFGVAIKPALVFGWQRLLDLQISSMGLLGSTSQGKLDEEGTGYITTPAQVRTTMLQQLTERGPLQLTQFIPAIKVGRNSIAMHADNLKKAGIVTVERKTTTYGQPITLYEITGLGAQASDWPVAMLRDNPAPRISERVRDALLFLVENGQDPTLRAIRKYISDTTGHEYHDADLATVLTFFVDNKLVERSKFNAKKFSEVTLTPLGQSIVAELITPLVRWCENPYAIPEIFQIAENLQRNPQAYTNLYRPIAEHFVTHSPFKNHDTTQREIDFLRIVQNAPQPLTQSDITRMASMSKSTVHKVKQALLKTGEIEIVTQSNGRQVILVTGKEVDRSQDKQVRLPLASLDDLHGAFTHPTIQKLRKYADTHGIAESDLLPHLASQYPERSVREIGGYAGIAFDTTAKLLTLGGANILL